MGFRTCRERGALGGTPGFQTLETLESSSLGSGGRWVKAAETELKRTPKPQVPQALSVQTALFTSNWPEFIHMPTTICNRCGENPVFEPSTLLVQALVLPQGTGALE